VSRWLSAVPAAATVARQQTAATLSEWCLAAVEQDAMMVASELVANAVNACVAARAGGPDRFLDWIAVRLADTGRRLTIEVFDAAPGVPARRAPDPLAETGRGLHLIDAVATWDCYSTNTGPGKVVRAALDHDGPDANHGEGSRHLPQRVPTDLTVGHAPAGHEMALLRRIHDGLTGISARTGSMPSQDRNALSVIRVASRS
jgi:hypothetical protein